MRIGVFTALFQNLPFEEALEKGAAGVTAVEIGAGGYPGSQHCPVDTCWRVKPNGKNTWKRSRRVV